MTLFVDGHNLLFRAFHGVPNRLIGRDERPINAVVGFIGSLLNRIREHAVDKVLVVFDSEGGSFRDAEPGYKSGRTRDYGPLDPAANPFGQLADIKQALDVLRFRWLELEGLEADDVIAAYCRAFAALGEECLILSTDVDLFQLVQQGVSVVPNSSRQIHEADVVARFGIPPTKIPFLRALTGDRSDSIGGVRGIGSKTAQTLVGRYRDPRDLFEALPDLPQRVQRALAGKRADVEHRVRLMTLDTVVRLELTLDNLRINLPDEERTMAVLKRARIT